MKKIPLALFVMATLFTNIIFAQDSTAKKGWTPVDRTDFINDCIKSAKANLGEDTARNYCYCMQAKVEQKYPSPADLVNLTAATMETPEWKKEIQACLNSNSNWTTKDRSDFYTDCVKTATNNLGEAKAKTYCSCMLVKIEKKYPNVAGLSAVTAATMQSPEFKKMVQDCLDNY